jgi:phosphoribosylglycinamide formyltransferase 1
MSDAGTDPRRPGAAGAPTPRITVLISGRGSNLRALIDACTDGRIPAQIVAVISNRPEAPGLAFAQAAGIPWQVIDHRHFPDREAFDAALSRAIDRDLPDWILLAGFMRVLTEGFVRRHAGRLVNIHPSLLPAFRGLDTHARALAAGVERHGASVHFVTPDLDGGPVIMQAEVPVLEGDSPERLAARVQAAEHRLYPAACALLCRGEVRQSGAAVCHGGEPLREPLQLEPAEVSA